jgi:branched-chain amino acid transport system substrate-binding protein
LAISICSGELTVSGYPFSQIVLGQGSFYNHRFAKFFKGGFMKRSLIAAVLMSVLAIFSVGSVGESQAAEKELVIGSVQDLSGPWSSSGKPIIAGRADYARYVNEKLGGVDGAKFKVISMDTGYNIDREISAYKKFLDVDRALFMINANSAAAYAINNMMEESKRGMPFTHTAEPTIIFRGKGSWYFGSTATAADGTVGLIRWWIEDVWKKREPPRIGLVNSDVAPGQVSALYAREVMQERGIPPAAEFLIPPMPMDISNFAMQMRKANLDMVVGLQTNAGWTVTLRDLGKFSVPATRVVSCCLSDRDIKTLGPNAAGIYVGFNTPIWSDTDVPAVKLIRKLRAEWGINEPADVNYFWGWMQGAIVCEAITRAVKKAGSFEKFNMDIDKARHLIRDVMENDMKGFDAMGMCRPLQYEPNDHRPFDASRFYHVESDLSLKFIPNPGPWPMAEKYKNTKWWLDAMAKAKK